MTRRDREAGIFKSLVIGAALMVGLAIPAHAQDTKLTLSGSATFTTDYMFRSISNTKDLPAVQPEIDLDVRHVLGLHVGIEYPVWGSIEIDYGAGISPKWGNFTFTFGGFAYTYPGATTMSIMLK